MTTKEFIILSSVSSSASPVDGLKKPFAVGRLKTPDSLNDLSLGDLSLLQSISNEDEFIFRPCEILLHLSREKILKAKAEEVLGFSVWVAKEVQRINRMFADVSVSPTSEEMQAGASALNFGPFGLIDWYTLRMGFHSHQEAEDTSWVIVLKCLEIDTRKLKYERKLRQIMTKK